MLVGDEHVGWVGERLREALRPYLAVGRTCELAHPPHSPVATGSTPDDQARRDPPIRPYNVPPAVRLAPDALSVWFHSRKVLQDWVQQQPNIKINDLKNMFYGTQEAAPAEA